MKRKRVLAAAAALASAIALLYAFPPALIVPPVILPAASAPQLRGEWLLPLGTEDVALEVEPGVFLRGVFVPSDEGAPVVAHFPPSSIAAGSSVELARALQELADVGFASLLVDYRGVGVSDGARSPAHLRVDADRVFGEALRRAGGDEARVVLRGTSIGALAVAHLLARGAAPGAVLLIAPVRDETVAPNFARSQLGAWWMRPLAPFLRRPIDVDLVSVLASVRVPLHVEMAVRDELLPENERELVQQAVARAHGRVTLNLFGGHVQAANRADRLAVTERAVLHDAFPEVPDVDQRLSRVLDALDEVGLAAFESDPSAFERLRNLIARKRAEVPRAVAAAAFASANARLQEAWLDALRARPRSWLCAASFDECRSHFDTRDEGGKLDEEALVGLLNALHLDAIGFSSLRTGDHGFERPAEVPLDAVLGWLRSFEPDAGEVYAATRRTNSFPIGKFFALRACEDLIQRRAWPRAVCEDGVDVERARRRILRLVLKANLCRERASTNAGGSARIEVWHRDTWQEIDLTTACLRADALKAR